jgi:hypothetical protein
MDGRVDMNKHDTNETRELTACELDSISGGGRTNGDDPFVKAVLDAFDKTLRGWPPAGRGDCGPNHNGV